MTTRTIRSVAVFNDAFTLGGIDGALPAGRYRIEIEEERIESLSFVAFRRLETTIEIPAIGSDSPKRQIVPIDPLDLAAAQERDSARPLQAPH